MSERKKELIIIIAALTVSTILIIAMIITDYRIKQAAKEADALPAEVTSQHEDAGPSLLPATGQPE